MHVAFNPTPSQLDAMAYSADDFDDPPGPPLCQREGCEHNRTYLVKLPGAPFFHQLLCKACIRLLNSFPGLHYEVECPSGILLGRNHQSVVAWLQEDGNQENLSQ